LADQDYNNYLLSTRRYRAASTHICSPFVLR
jgi:hypothetical protein